MSSLQQSTNAFDALPIRQAVFRQTFPAIASQMITLIYNLADTYFVGMLNQPSQTAAITVVYSSFLMLTAISNLFGVGGASALARALGRKAPDEARRIASISFWFGLFSGALFCLLFWCFRQPILVLCGATQDTLPIALGYAQWVVVIGGPATILSTLLANLVRAEGKAGQASFGLSLGGAANLVLDPLFILPQFLGLGAVGAGMATCLSNVLSTLYFLVHLLRCQGETAVDLHPRHLPFIRKYGKEILAIGFPSALQYALTVVAVAAQSRFVSRYATEAVAGLGIVKKLDQLPLYFSIGVSNGLLPLLAYHYAAGQQEKRRAAFRLGCTLSLAFALLCELAGADSAAPPLPPLVEAAIEDIRQNYAGLYGVEELSERLGVSKSHLVRTFTAAVGVPPGRYLTTVRVEAAMRLLLHREYTLDVIASLCGFSGANYLCRVFKKETGQSPAQWRALAGQTARPLSPAESQREQALYI